MYKSIYSYKKSGVVEAGAVEEIYKAEKSSGYHSMLLFHRLKTQ